MKTLALTIAITCLSILGFSQDSKGQNITVTIDQIKNNKGHILLGLHTADTFMKADAVTEISAEIKDGKVVAVFENVEPGTYAILVLHDENDNETMDFEASGMPIETYGITNNPRLMGPPQFGEAKFEVADKDLDLHIELM